MKVKICGITNSEDAHAAIEAGVNALGFIFSTSSRRFIQPRQAGEIIRTLPPFVTAVGVFVNNRREEILQTIATAGIQAIQFHGDETPDDLQGYNLPAYKAFRVFDGFEPAILQHYDRGTFLLDTFVDGAEGGTGKTFEWDIAVRAKRYGNVILSGGLRPENIEEAVRRVQPYAIDVNSGVESAPGKKDKVKINEVFSILRTMQECAC